MKKITFEVPVPSKAPVSRDKAIIRVDPEVYADIAHLAKKTRLPIGGVANRLLRAAMAEVELVEVPLYNMVIHGEDASDE